jgi:long-subunit fatty acid transport protein
VSYRSEITFTAEGDQTSDVSATSGATPSPTVSAGLKNALTGKSSISNLFPQQANLGGFFKASETLKVALEYSFTNYSKNKGLTIDGPGAGPASVIVQNWKNQHIGRVGFEYTGTAMPIRAGYAITSQVTPSDRARSTFASPGKGHAIALGSSYPLMANLDLDFAGEYSFAKGKGNNDPEVASEAEFKSRGMVGHLSAKYRF